jgi:hypothetical protein
MQAQAQVRGPVQGQAQGRAQGIRFEQWVPPSDSASSGLSMALQKFNQTFDTFHCCLNAPL